MGNRVAYIAALDYEHHIFITEWAKAFPSAKLLGVEGLAEKREKDQATAGNKFQHVWTQKNKGSMKVDPDFDQEFDYEFVGSHANKELVLLHKRDRTLIEAEYVFSQSVSPLLILETSLEGKFVQPIQPFHFREPLGCRMSNASKFVVLLLAECATREKLDRFCLPGASAVHTRSYTLSKAGSLRGLPFRVLTVKQPKDSSQM